MFTDSITIPGEKINVGAFDTFIGDIPYPYMERRATSNTLSIGMYVDIYATLETKIGDIIRRHSYDGIKISNDEKLQIQVLGFRMGSENSIVRQFFRPCYIRYAFTDCIPISMDEYTYDHKNSNWARTRNVTFAFRSYKVYKNETKFLNDEEALKVSKPTPDWQTIQETKMAKGYTGGTPVTTEYWETIEGGSNGSIVYKAVDNKKKSSVDTPFSQITTRSKPMSEANAEKVLTHFKKANQEATGPTKFKNDREELSKELDKIVPLKSSWNKIYWFDEAATFIKRDDSPYSPSVGGENQHYEETTQVGSRHGLITVANPSADTVMGHYGKYRREGLLTNIINTAVNKFLIPDTPLYNSGHGMAWQPGFMKDVSKAIRKVQQWFYTEPKYKDTPEDDHPLINTHAKANAVGVDPDDTPTLRSHADGNVVEVPYYDHIVNHGPADTIKIPQEDFTRQTQHGDPNTVAIDPNDYTKQNEHGDPNTVAIDPDDYTRQNAHGEPNNVPVDPNDHTLQNTHGEASRVMIDPDDYTRQNAHGEPNNVPVDPNDHTAQNAHGDADLIFADDDDAPVQTKSQGHQIPINQNDFVRTNTLNPNMVPIEPNDHIIDSTNIDANLVPINPDDYVVGTNVHANTLLIDPKDYVSSINIKADHVKIAQNDHITDQDTIEYKNIKIEEQDYANAEDALKGDFNYIPTNSNDRTSVFDHETANLVPADQNDKITDHRKPENMVKIDPNDKMTAHRNQGNQIPVDSRDTPDLSSLKPKHVPVEQSYIEFARLIINSVKTGSDSIKDHNENVNLKKIADDKLVTHEKFGLNIVERPDEAQSIIPNHNRDTGHLVDVHEKDHTELN